MKGYSLDELEPKLQTWEDLVHPDDLPGAYEKLNAHFEGETNFYEAEFRMKHKSGKWIWILDRGEIIERDKEENPLRACGTHKDITERKEAENRIKYLNSLLKSIRNVNQITVQGEDLNEVMQGACEALVKERTYVESTIALLDDETDEISPTAEAGEQTFTKSGPYPGMEPEKHPIV